MFDRKIKYENLKFSVCRSKRNEKKYKRKVWAITMSIDYSDNE